MIARLVTVIASLGTGDMARIVSSSGVWAWCTTRRSSGTANEGRVDQHVTSWTVVMVVVAHCFFFFTFCKSRYVLFIIQGWRFQGLDPFGKWAWVVSFCFIYSFLRT